MSEPIKNTEALVASKKTMYLDTVEADSALSPTTLGGMMRLAEVISSAGLCPKHLKGDAGSTMLVMAAAQQLGLPWFTGLQKAYVIDGKVAFEAVVLMACAKRSKDCVALYLEEVTDDKATMVVRTKDMAEPKRITYTYAEAQKAGLTGKGPWNSYRKNMLVARVATNVSRWYFQEETLGIFTKEELEEAAEVVAIPATPKNVTPPVSITEALDRVAAPALPEPSPEPKRGPGRPRKEEPKPEPAPEKVVAPEPVQPAATGKQKLWEEMATRLLGPTGKITMLTFAKSKFGGKSFDEMTEAEEDALDTFLNETKLAVESDVQSAFV